MKSFLLYILFFISFGANSQDLNKEFEKMNSYLSTLKNYSLSVDYQVGDASEPDSGKVSVIVSPEGLFYDFGSSKMIINHSNTILIEGQSKTIIYSDNKEVKLKKSISLSEQMIRGIDTLVSKSDSISFYLNGKSRVYNLRFENGYFNLVQLEFQEHILTKVIYYYNSDFVHKEGLKTICFMKVEENIDIQKHFFQTSYYIKENNGTMVPSSNFNNYLIIYNESLENFID